MQVLQKELFRIKSFEMLQGRKNILKEAHLNPVLGGVRTNKIFDRYKGGILKIEDFVEQEKWDKYGHQVVITGFDATEPGNHFIQIRNSRGESWGEEGYGKLHLPSKKSGKEIMGVCDIDREGWKIMLYPAEK